MRSKLRQWRKAARGRLNATPLFLPLVAVVGVVVGGVWFYLLSGAALLAAAVCGRFRIALYCLLCLVVAVLQEQRAALRLQEFEAGLQKSPVIEVQGVVECTLSKSCILRDEETGVRIVLRADEMPWRAGDCLRVRAQVLPERAVPVEGMFDSGNWLRCNGLAASAACIDAQYVGHPFSWAAVIGVADEMRARLAHLLMAPAKPGDARAQVLCALVLGDKTYSEPETINEFRRGGCLHIFAVSGLHVGIVALLVHMLLRKLLLRSRLRSGVVIVFSGLYVLMTGMSIPALRAWLMLALLLLGRELKRPVSMANIWCAAALLVLLAAPWQLQNAGFLLSFAVYAAICVGVRYGMVCKPWVQPDPFIPKRIYTRYERWLLRADFSLRGVVIVSLSAWLVALPITMLYFHTFNLYGVLTNIAITPLLLPLMLVGILALVLSAVPMVGAAVHALALYGAGMLLGVVGAFSDMPAAYLPHCEPQSPQSLMVLGAGYGQSVCVLGNPGAVIVNGMEQTARFCAEPAVFHSGFSPVLMLDVRKDKDDAATAAVLADAFPGLRCMNAYNLADELTVYETPAGTFTLIPPPQDINPSPAENHAPVIHWQGAGRSVLYVGDASLLTLERVPLRYLAVDYVICGYNKGLPVPPARLTELMPLAQLIVLPVAAAYTEVDWPQDAMRVSEAAPLLIP